MTVVIDASVACKWFFEEALSGEARVLAASEASFVAPDLILAECASAAWRRVRDEGVSQAQARAFLRSLPSWFDRLAPSVQLHEMAFEMACTMGHPVYDCVYLALAEQERAQLVTADRAFADRTRDTPWSTRLQLLGAGVEP